MKVLLCPKCHSPEILLLIDKEVATAKAYILAVFCAGCGEQHETIERHGNVELLTNWITEKE